MLWCAVCGVYKLTKKADRLSAIQSANLPVPPYNALGESDRARAIERRLVRGPRGSVQSPRCQATITIGILVNVNAVRGSPYIRASLTAASSTEHFNPFSSQNLPAQLNGQH